MLMVMELDYKTLDTSTTVTLTKQAQVTLRGKGWVGNVLGRQTELMYSTLM